MRRLATLLTAFSLGGAALAAHAAEHARIAQRADALHASTIRGTAARPGPSLSASRPDAQARNSTLVQRLNLHAAPAVPMAHHVTVPGITLAGGAGNRQRPPPLSSLGGAATARPSAAGSLSGRGVRRRF